MTWTKEHRQAYAKRQAESGNAKPAAKKMTEEAKRKKRIYAAAYRTKNKEWIKAKNRAYWHAHKNELKFRRCMRELNNTQEDNICMPSQV